ncbi:MAG TPA: zinc ribbon domain-containing protein [Verrucomicrobiae bacterium]|nr:zinc ribbon domain-containing protein [Verrucomicrobiae bacterium]
MPIYEFHCEDCERDSEILVRSSNWKNSECPHCGSKNLSKKFSTFAAAGTGASSETRGTRLSASGGNGGGHCCGGGCHCH